MRQQINLFQDQFKPKKEWMTLSHVGTLLLLVLAGFASLYYQQLLEVQKTEEELTGFQNQQQNILAQMEKLSALQKERRKSFASKGNVRLKEKQLAARKELIKTLSKTDLGNKTGFSEYLAGLARQHVEGTWITGLSVAAGGQVLLVSGNTLKPELVPVYMQKLSNEVAYAGKKFAIMELSRKEDEPMQLGFVFKTSKSNKQNLDQEAMDAVGQLAGTN